jgi:3-hydroxyacyl-CoA dehydrogenase
MTIGRVAVIGAGVMGGGIAAQVANAGVPVLLLDIVPKESANRNAVAERALAAMRKADPAPFMSEAAAARVTVGNIEDDLDRLATCDWVVEAVVEDLGIKRRLYADLERVMRPGAIVSSNTSTMPLKLLVEGRSEAFRRAFLITHFFNPPRYMRLLEIVRGPDTDPALAARIEAFADVRLGKGIVHAKDTPGFVANRIGALWLEAAYHAALDEGLTVEEADAIVGRPMGVPKTGIFGLLDLIGIDLMPKVAASLLATLPADDPYRAVNRPLPQVERMIAAGLTGRKGKGGFYRLAKGPDGARVKESLDLATGAYAPSRTPEIAAVAAAKTGGLPALVASPDRHGRFAATVLGETLSYAAHLVPDVADDIVAVDRAMRLGYAWGQGPFELIDAVGPAWLAAWLAERGRPVPPLLGKAVAAGGFYAVAEGRLTYLTVDGGRAPVERPAGVIDLADVKRAGPPVAKNRSASLWDLGDGVTCLEFTTKRNTFDDGVLEMLERGIAVTAQRFRAMVVYNDGPDFSLGANLGLALFAANVAAWDQIELLVAAGQRAYRALRAAPIPVVVAPAGMALGGGCEILLHAPAVQAHAETYCGLVETGVGLVPAWGGCTEMLYRASAPPPKRAPQYGDGVRALLARAAALRDRPGGPMPPVTRTFETIALARVAKSAFEAQELLYLRPSDGITMNRDRLLADAKARALAMAEAGWTPPAEPEPLHLPGETGVLALGLGIEALRLQGKTTPHDLTVAAGLSRVLTGGDTDMLDPVPVDALLRLEREEFMRLVRTEGTLARIAHTLETGKPLRN